MKLYGLNSSASASECSEPKYPKEMDEQAEHFDRCPILEQTLRGDSIQIDIVSP